MAAFMILAGSLITSGAVLAVNQTGAFELDGNAVSANAPAPVGPTDDWDRVCHEVTDGAVCASATDTNGATAVSWLAESDPSASIFTGGGSKDPQDPQDSWLWKDDGGLPDKDNLLHGFAARYSLAPSATNCPTDPDGSGPLPAFPTCEVIYFGSDRYANDGDAVQGFWFFQSKIEKTATASGGGFKFSGHHVNGDLLIISDFSNGGNVSTIVVHKWDTTCAKAASNNPAVNDCSAANLRLLASSDAANCATSAATAGFCGIVNTGATNVTSPWPFLDKAGSTSFRTGEFFEGGVNLSTLGLGGECFASVASETRSSTSPTATLKDFVLDNFGECTSGLVTTPSAGQGGSVAIGSNGTYSATDSANLTISGAATWTGTLKFFICAPLASGSCDGTTNVGTQVGTDRTVTNATAKPYVSDAYSVTAAGRYCWRATFTSGTTGVPDAADGTATECFTVTPLTPGIATQVKKVSDNSNVTTVPIGTAVYDTATLTGSFTTNAGGTVRYRLFTNDTCTTLDTSTAGTAYNAQSDVTVTNATVPNSANITLNTAGTFYFQATYQTGDANNVAGAKSPCTSETVIVQAAPVVHSTPQVQIWDSITVTGLSTSPAPTGNLVVGIFTNNTCTTRLTGNVDQTFLISAAQPFVTTATSVVAGTYYFKVAYAGDAVNASFSSCNEEIVGVTITSKP
jgi:hypothetical protein